MREKIIMKVIKEKDKWEEREKKYYIGMKEYIIVKMDEREEKKNVRGMREEIIMDVIREKEDG